MQQKSMNQVYVPEFLYKNVACHTLSSQWKGGDVLILMFYLPINVVDIESLIIYLTG